MARKTTKAVLEIIHLYEENRDHYLQILDLRETVDPEYWTDYTRSLTPEVVQARMDGMICILEAMMHQHNCYHGFSYVGTYGDFIKHTDPGFKEWSRKYFVKG